MNNNLSLSIIAALRAGVEILQVYKSEIAVELKDDRSPLTEADRRAHEVIQETLAATGIPLLSEEGKAIPYEERSAWERFWLVDPLDGTKEFIKRNGEFTVNIALMEKGAPVLGVVYAPVMNTLYYGSEDAGSFKLDNVPAESGLANLYKETAKALADAAHNASEAQQQAWETAMGIGNAPAGLPLQQAGRPYTVVASRSHRSPETEAIIDEKKQQHGNVEIASMGSSLKICLVAEGAADIYPRLAPTMEWDTAAGHAVARFAGCRVYEPESGAELRYNKENLLNPWFIVER